MKKLFAGIIVVFVLIAGGQVTADPVTDGSRASLSDDFTLTEKINDIDVPYPVLLDAQMNNQGYAVVNVYKVTRDGQELYRLHIKSGTNKTRENIYLIYDKNWQFIEDERTWAPLPVKVEEPDPEEPPKQIEEVPKPEVTRPLPDETNDEDDQEPPVEEEPTGPGEGGPRDGQA